SPSAALSPRCGEPAPDIRSNTTRKRRVRRDAPPRPPGPPSLPVAVVVSAVHGPAEGKLHPREMGNIVEVAVVDHLEQHVAFELVEEFLYRIVMIVRALVRAADHLHGHLAVFEHLLVADRRLEQMP